MRTSAQFPSSQRSHKEGQHNPSVRSEGTDSTQFAQGEMGPVTPHNILQLQRLIGNQGVQRLIPVRQPVAQPLQRLQRAKKDDPTREDKGLMEEDVPDRFLGNVKAFTSDPQHADADLAALKEDMKEDLNAELNNTGVPSVFDVSLVPTIDAAGLFYEDDWKMEVNPQEMFGGEEKHVRDLTEDQIEYAAATFYHEGRHAEQYFRIAQLRVTELLKNKPKPEPDAIKKQLITELNMPDQIIEAAIANPLDRAADREIVREIKLWDRSRFGADRSYRDLIKVSMKFDVLEPLDDSIDAFLALMPEGGNPLPEEGDELEALKMAIVVVEKHLDNMEQYQKNVLHSELERVKAVDDPKLKANNETIIGHLSTLVRLTNGIRAYRPLPFDDLYLAAVNAARIAYEITQIQIELFNAYLDLPMEEDAFDAGNEVKETEYASPREPGEQ